MQVGLKDVTDEQYTLRAQEELGLCVGADGTVGGAKRADDLIEDLLSHARDGQRLHHARLHDAPLDSSMALAIALRKLRAKVLDHRLAAKTEAGNALMRP